MLASIKDWISLASALNQLSHFRDLRYTDVCCELGVSVNKRQCGCVSGMPKRPHNIATICLLERKHCNGKVKTFLMLSLT